MIHLHLELKQRVDTLLAKLATLSDAPVQRLNDAAPAKRPQAHMRPGETFGDHSRSRRPSKDSREPPGVRERRRTAPSPEHDPLFDWFVHRLQAAQSASEVKKICTIAEARWERATGRTKAPLALAANPETTKSRDERIATDPDYLREPPEVVAAAETHVSGYVSPENVRRVRLAAGRDPETGEPLPPERQLRGPARKLRARELYADGEGVGVSEIARRFGVSRPTIYNWLGRSEQDAA